MANAETYTAQLVPLSWMEHRENGSEVIEIVVNDLCCMHCKGKASAVQCAFGFEAAARTASTGRSDRGCQGESSHKAKKGKPVKCLFSVDGLCTRFGRARVEAAISASPAGR